MFVKKYGNKQVRTKTFGSANYRAALDAGLVFYPVSDVIGPARVSAGR